MSRIVQKRNTGKTKEEPTTFIFRSIKRVLINPESLRVMIIETFHLIGFYYESRKKGGSNKIIFIAMHALWKESEMFSTKYYITDGIMFSKFEFFDVGLSRYKEIEQDLCNFEVSHKEGFAVYVQK